MILKATVSGTRQLLKDLDVRSKQEKRALQTAIKVEGFNRLKELRREVKAGTPAGKAYAEQLSQIARRTKTGRFKKNQIPLYRLARLLKYNVSYSSGQLQFTFGFTDTKFKKLAGGYKQLLIKHQEGLGTLYRGSRKELGERFARIGGKLKKKGDPDAKYFFLRKTTGRKIDLPKRPIIEPFFERYKPGMIRNIRANYKRKLRGERI